jgi:hypothetical protein
MAAVESSAGSSDLTLRSCPGFQKPTQRLGGAGEGQQPTVTPDLRSGPSRGLTAGTDEHPLPEPRCDQWCGDPHACSQEAQRVVLPAVLPGCWVEGSNELVRRAEDARYRREHPNSDGVRAGRPSSHGGGACQESARDQGELEESSEGDSERQRETECVAANHHHPLGRQGSGYDGGRGSGTKG